MDLKIKREKYKEKRKSLIIGDCFMARWIWEWNFFKDEPWISATTKNACETVMGTWSRILKTMKSDSVLER